MPKEINKKTLQKQQIVESYLATSAKAKFNDFVTKKEKSISAIDVGATSALHLMQHWISLYNNLTSTRRATAKLIKFPTRASAKFQAIYKKMKALRSADVEYETNSIITLGRYAETASNSLNKFRKCSSVNEEETDINEEETEENEENTEGNENETEEQDDEQGDADKQEDDADELEDDADEKEMNRTLIN